MARSRHTAAFPHKAARGVISYPEINILLYKPGATLALVITPPPSGYGALSLMLCVRSLRGDEGERGEGESCTLLYGHGEPWCEQKRVPLSIQTTNRNGLTQTVAIARFDLKSELSAGITK